MDALPDACLLSILEFVKSSSADPADLRACASVSKTWRELAFDAKGSILVTSGPSVTGVLKLLAEFSCIHTVCLQALEEIDVLLMCQGIAREALNVKTLHLVSCKALCSMGTSGLLVTFSISQQGHVADYQQFSIERPSKGQRTVRWRLKELLLDSSPLDDHQLQALLDNGRGAHLESLSLRSCPRIRGWGLSHCFQNCCPNLQNLSLADMDHLGPSDPKLPTSRPSDSVRTHRLASGLSSGLLTGLVAGVSVLPKTLKTLNLQGPGAASLLRTAAEGCPNLRALFLSADRPLDGFSLADVAAGQLAQLETLGLIGERTSTAAIESFLDTHPAAKLVKETAPVWGHVLSCGALKKAQRVQPFAGGFTGQPPFLMR